jgi:C1A family cysteine protease
MIDLLSVIVWGEDWGDKGFAYASSKYAKKAFDEAYGISV